MVRLLIAFLRFQLRLLSLMFKGIVISIRSMFGIHNRSGPITLRSSASPGVPPTPGQFIERAYANEAGSRQYKVYIPNMGPRRKFRALVVMLHGCTQDPDDFATGTRMNQLADSGEFLVAYPAQPSKANGMRCWNWYDPDNQARDQGEPSLIAGITRELAAEFGISSQHIYVAGLSAGAAMAMTMGVNYPDLFAAVGVHSGLPFGAARSLQTAMAAMQGRGSESLLPLKSSLTAIVFHGDRDSTISIDNGAKVVEQATAAYAALEKPLTAAERELESANGRGVSVTVYSDARKRPIVEYWMVHGAGHAWSGGSSEGSQADEKGPNASEEMIRFFFAAEGRTVSAR
jgi:poly(hydroxyalkanoate) depolymerase family esterase